MIFRKSARKTDYHCCKNVADKPFFNIWPIIGASLPCIYMSSILCYFMNCIIKYTLLTCSSNKNQCVIYSLMPMISVLFGDVKLCPTQWKAISMISIHAIK